MAGPLRVTQRLSSAGKDGLIHLYQLTYHGLVGEVKHGTAQAHRTDQANAITSAANTASTIHALNTRWRPRACS